MAQAGPPRVLIAGAGIAGLTAALALARAGFACTILEQAPELAEIGAGLQLSPNATRILARLGLLEPILAVALRPDGVRVRAARSGRTLSWLPLGDAEGRWGAPYLVVRRAALQRVLVEAARAEPAIGLHLGTALAGFGTTPAGVVVTARHGLLSRSFEGEVLVGADGVRSVVRRRLVSAAADEPRDTGRTAWRATVPTSAAPAALRGAETGLWMGRHAHLVHYAIGDAINVVAITADPPLRSAAERGRGTTRSVVEGAAVASFSGEEGSSQPVEPRGAGAPSTAFGGPPPPLRGGGSTATSDLWARSGDPAAIRARFAGWHGEARALIAAAPSWTGWPLFDRAPLPAWNAGPVALAGDAAHPILPFLAQGAAQAIEDAAALAAALSAQRDVAAALAAYSAARILRANRVQQASRELGRIYHLGGPAAAARDVGMRLLGPRRLAARYDWLYGSVS